jgi:hypothetical protein
MIGLTLLESIRTGNGQEYAIFRDNSQMHGLFEDSGHGNITILEAISAHLSARQRKFMNHLSDHVRII